jgi:hypothetical protein
MPMKLYGDTSQKIVIIVSQIEQVWKKGFHDIHFEVIVTEFSALF